MARSTRIIFITGTDTGVGKTLLTGFLLEHLRQRDVRALAMKPFCSGGTADVDLLLELQGEALSRREVNPYYFPEPVAPLISCRRRGRRISLQATVAHIKKVARRCKVLLIEGSGGLLVPLGEGFGVLDLIKELPCEVIVVSRNRLGTINHTLLTVRTLLAAGVTKLRIALTNAARLDESGATNAQLLTELLAPVPLVVVPFVGPKATNASAIQRRVDTLEGTLGRLLR